MVHQIFGGLGAYAGAAILDAAGGYDVGFVVMLISAVIALGLTMMLGGRVCDGAEQGVLLAEPPEVILSLERHERRMRQMAGEVLARAEPYGAVAAPMQHQCFRGDPRQQGADIGLGQRAQHLTDRNRRRGLAQQPRPPGAQCRLVRGAGREHLDRGGLAPVGHQLRAPGLDAAGCEGERVIGSPASARQRAVEDQACHVLRRFRGEP